MRLKQIEFVRLEPEQALAVLVAENGAVENRILNVPPGLPASALVEAANYLNARIRGRTLAELRADIEASRVAAREGARRTHRAPRRRGACRAGRARKARPSSSSCAARRTCWRTCAPWRTSSASACCSTISETKKDVIDLLARAETGEGVRIFIGSENKLFSLSGSSMIAAPFRDASQKIVGVVGVIGPTRLNYARIVPMVDYTAKVVSRLVRG